MNACSLFVQILHTPFLLTLIQKYLAIEGTLCCLFIFLFCLLSGWLCSYASVRQCSDRQAGGQESSVVYKAPVLSSRRQPANRKGYCRGITKTKKLPKIERNVLRLSKNVQFCLVMKY